MCPWLHLWVHVKVGCLPCLARVLKSFIKDVIWRKGRRRARRRTRRPSLRAALLSGSPGRLRNMKNYIQYGAALPSRLSHHLLGSSREDRHSTPARPRHSQSACAAAEPSPPLSQPPPPLLLPLLHCWRVPAPQVSERLSPARWGRAALPAGASLPVLSPSALHLRGARGPAARAASLLWVPRRPPLSRPVGPGSAWPPSAAPRARASGPRDEAADDSMRAARAEPPGARPPQSQGRTSSAPPFPAPAVQAAEVGGPRVRRSPTPPVPKPGGA